jgi:hypothetical protein
LGLVGAAFQKWKWMNEEVNEENREIARRGRMMKKVMIMIRCRTLSLAMRLWKKKDEMLANARLEQIRAGKLMKKVMTRFCNAKLDAGLKHWHRATMLVKEEQMREELKKEQEDMRRKSLSLGKQVRGGRSCTTTRTIIGKFDYPHYLTHHHHFRNHLSSRKRRHRTLARS